MKGFKMYNHNFTNMVESLVLSGIVSPENSKKAIEKLKEYWKDKIALVWSTEYVINRAKEIGVTISEDDAKNVLQQVLDNHDRNYGVTWEILDNYIIDAR